MAYNEYNGRNIGRLLRFLYEYNHRSDEATFHSEQENPMITLYGEPFANYVWEAETDIPHFTFLGKYTDLQIVQKQTKNRILEWENLERKNNNVSIFIETSIESYLTDFKKGGIGRITQTPNETVEFFKGYLLISEQDQNQDALILKAIKDSLTYLEDKRCKITFYISSENIMSEFHCEHAPIWKNENWKGCPHPKLWKQILEKSYHQKINVFPIEDKYQKICLSLANKGLQMEKGKCYFGL
jgi:ribonuclease HI